MTNEQKLMIVAGVGVVTLGFLWWQHGGTPLATAAEPGDKMLGTTKVPIPKARARRTASNAPTVNAAAVEEPFTSLQYESAAALGFSSVEDGAAAASDDTTSRALNEDLAYLGIGQ